MRKKSNHILSCLLVFTLILSLLSPALAATVSVTGVSLNKTAATLAIDETLMLTATVLPENATNKGITWSSNKTSVATVSSNGLVTAKSVGSATITAKTRDGSYSALCNITVEKNYVTAVTVTPDTASYLPVGKTQQLKAEVTYAHKTTTEKGIVSWSSDTPAVATVSKSGLLTAVSEGTATIMAMAEDLGQNDTKVFRSVKFTVTKEGTTEYGDVLALAYTTQTLYSGEYMGLDIKAPSATVKNGTQDRTAQYTISYVWTNQAGTVLGTAETLTLDSLAKGQQTLTCTVTARSKTDSSHKKSVACTFTVMGLPVTMPGATLLSTQGTTTLANLKNQDGSLSVLDQLLKGGSEVDMIPAISGLTHVIFDCESVQGSDVGTFSAKTGTSYFVSSTAGGDLLSTLTFTPRKPGIFRVPFLAYGTQTYYGQLEFVVQEQGSGDGTEGGFVCRNGWLTFSGSDFYRAGDADPILSVTFGTPSAGRLLQNFDKGRGTPDAGRTYYTNAAADGDYHISILTYLPQAGFSGVATIPVTYKTKAGKIKKETMEITVPEKTASTQFIDVTPINVGTWAAGSIDFAYSLGLVGGMEEKLFEPSVQMTRAMLVTILYRTAGSPSVGVTSNFTDLDADAYYYTPVTWATVMGIVKGVTDTTFSPNAPVTREQIATILYRYAEIIDRDISYKGNLNAFSDKSSVSSYATIPMTWAVSRGIITGMTETTLSPKTSATRAQTVVMLHRYLAR